MSEQVVRLDNAILRHAASELKETHSEYSPLKHAILPSPFDSLESSCSYSLPELTSCVLPHIVFDGKTKLNQQSTLIGCHANASSSRRWAVLSQHTAQAMMFSCRAKPGTSFRSTTFIFEVSAGEVGTEFLHDVDRLRRLGRGAGTSNLKRYGVSR